MVDKQKKVKIIHAGHRQRVKNRFAEHGLLSFEDHQALELLLFYALPQKDTNVIAHALIDEFGSLSAVFEAPLEALKRVNGIGENTAILIKLIPEIYEKYIQNKISSETPELKSSNEACKYFSSMLRNKQKEVLVAAFLDSKLRIKKTVIIEEGSFSDVDVSLRKIVKKALDFRAPNIMLAHNHPSGVAAPSANDVETVRLISRTLESMDLHLCDSIIVAADECFSMADSKKFSYLFR